MELTKAVLRMRTEKQLLEKMFCILLIKKLPSQTFLKVNAGVA